MRSLIAVVPLLLLTSLLIGSNSAQAWGDKGHAVIALIAWQSLSAATRAQIEMLLQRDNSGLTATDFASEATWADAYRDSDRAGGPLHEQTELHQQTSRYEQTRRWHYVNLALAHPDFARACFGSPPLQSQQNASAGPAKACVVDKVEQFAAELKSARTSPAERLLALQFLIHLVGDLHQPLHACDNDDGGGNEVQVTAKNFKHGTLHGYWDNAVVAQLGRKPEAIARKLMRQTNPEQLARWQRGSIRDWTREAFGVARDIAYAKLPPADRDGVYVLDASYAEAAKRAAAQQLMRAGIRLAWLLEQSIPAR